MEGSFFINVCKPQGVANEEMPCYSAGGLYCISSMRTNQAVAAIVIDCIVCIATSSAAD